MKRPVVCLLAVLLCGLGSAYAAKAATCFAKLTCANGARLSCRSLVGDCVVGTSSVTCDGHSEPCPAGPTIASTATGGASEPATATRCSAAGDFLSHLPQAAGVAQRSR